MNTKLAKDGQPVYAAPSIEESIRILTARLPELEWKLERIIEFIQPSHLPHGLFRGNEAMELTPQTCIQEIYSDLLLLNEKKHESYAYYLAQRIQQKINALVYLCNNIRKNTAPKQQTSFGVQTLSTRQQWLKQLENTIQALTLQQDALLHRIETLSPQCDAAFRFNLQSELGEVGRRLTLAKETLQRQTLW